MNRLLFAALLGLALAVPSRAASPSLWEPFDGQVVGVPFTAAVDTGGDAYARADFYVDGVKVAETSATPFYTRLRVEGDGPRVVHAILTRSDGSTLSTPPVNVTVQHDLFANYPRVSDDGSGFVFPDGSVTVAVGQNDSYTWTGMNNLYNGNASGTESYVKNLRLYGVNVTRMMLEYAQNQSQLLENPIGTYNQKVIDFWDKFLPIAERNGLTVLITPWDTFWMDANWATNPYNAANGGPCATKREFITSRAARAAQKARIKMMIDRWGNSPAVFAWDILNEFDIKWTGATTTERAAWVADMAAYIQDYEMEKWGHRHMTTLSSVNAVPSGTIGNTIYRNPRFDFANNHHYLSHINNPQNWIDPALDVNYAVRYSLNYIRDGRPYMDTESGPIEVRPTSGDWDDRYFHYMMWAHFASGGAGTGMRWPYRNPHIVSDGMHRSQRALTIAAADFDWSTFRQQNIDGRITMNQADFIRMGCADEGQAVLWLAQDLRKGDVRSVNDATVTVSGMAPGTYYVRARSPYRGTVMKTAAVTVDADGRLTMELPTFQYDIVVTIVPMSPGNVAPGDGVGMEDVAAILRIAGGLEPAAPGQAINADLVADGRVTIEDAVALARRLAAED